MEQLRPEDAAAPLDGYIARDKFDLNDFYPQIIKPYRFASDRFGSGKLYGLPKEIAVRAMYYNADALRTAGIALPQRGQRWDWPTYLDHTRHLLKTQGDQTSQWGYVQEIGDGMAMIWAWAAVSPPSSPRATPPSTAPPPIARSSGARLRPCRSNG